MLAAHECDGAARERYLAVVRSLRRFYVGHAVEEATDPLKAPVALLSL